MVSGRDDDWIDIWRDKYECKGDKPLHVLDGYDALTVNQWEQLVRRFFGLVRGGLKANADILEVGCGAGAFLEHIGNCNSLSGVDYSENAIERIRERLEGDFRVADAAILPFDDGVFDGIISFSVFFYFSSLDYAARVLNEMRRVLRPGGSIFIGDVNDAAKKDLYYAIREDEGRHERKIRKDINSTHLFYEKGFFIDYASKNGFDITVVDEDKMGISYYSCALYRFSVVMKDKEGGS